MPSGAGGSPSVGVSSTSNSSKDAAIWRVARCRPCTAVRYRAASRPRPSLHQGPGQRLDVLLAWPRGRPGAPSPPGPTRCPAAQALMKSATKASPSTGRPASLDPVAQRLAQAGRRLRGRHAVGVHVACRWASWSGRRQRRLGGAFVAAAANDGPRRRRGPVGVAGHRARRRVEDGRAVAHRARRPRARRRARPSGRRTAGPASCARASA